MSRKNYIEMVPQDKLCPEILKKIVPLLDKVIPADGDNTIETSLMELWQGDTQLWVINDFEALMVTRVFTRGVKKILSIDMMAGKNIRHWIKDWIRVENSFAGDNECDRVEFATTRLCEKTVAHYNPAFRPEYTVYRRDL